MFELKGEPEKDANATPSPSAADVAPQARLPLRCRECSQVVTHDDARSAIDGEHEHMRVNPAGYVYRFGCFSEAGGCVVSGEPTEAYTWFSGCRWQFAHCSGCRTHLGWSFSGLQSFFGLLLDRLVAQQ